MRIEKWDEANWGPLTEANMRRKLEAEGYSVASYTYPPGTVFPDHRHPFDKKDAVLQGRFKIRMQHEEVILEPGDMIEVPAHSVHSAEVVGQKPVVSLDASRYE